MNATQHTPGTPLTLTTSRLNADIHKPVRVTFVRPVTRSDYDSASFFRVFRHTTVLVQLVDSTDFEPAGRVIFASLNNLVAD